MVLTQHHDSLTDGSFSTEPVRSLIGGLNKERFQRTTQVIKLAPEIIF